MSLSVADREEIQVRIQLAIEQYFNHYLTEVLPETLDRALTAHDQNCGAHGGVAKKVERYRWWILGAAFGVGLIGAKLFGFLSIKP